MTIACGLKKTRCRSVYGFQSSGSCWNRETSDLKPFRETILSTAPEPPIFVDRQGRLRLEFLDGLRAVAALYVVIHHMWREVTSRPEFRALPEPWHKLGWVLAWGHYAVGVFIVLSGYCLMLPVVRDGAGELRGGALGFLKRRALRILPPYYAAVALSLILIAFVPGLNAKLSGFWASMLPALTPSVVISHLLLIHNLNGQWAFKIDAPLWSVATEWQIYFFLPFMILPIWRRYGLPAAVLAPFVLAYAVHLIPGQPVDTACPWYLGLFAMGVAAADISFGNKDFYSRVYQRAPWGWIASALALVLVYLFWKHFEFSMDHTAHVDPIDGAMTVCLILYCTRRVTTGRAMQGFNILRVLDSRPIVAVGRFSYSIYLIHMPVVALVHLALLKAGLDATHVIVGMYVLGLPTVLIAAYGFHLVAERPFLRSGTSPRKPDILPAPLAPPAPTD